MLAAPPCSLIVGDDHLRSLLSKEAGNRLADAGAGPRNQGTFAIETKHPLLLLG